MGFCLFNQVAIAAIYAHEQYHLDRVAIVDFDVHHGNGSQDICRGREGLFYLSTHQSPLYPGTGMVNENSDNNILNVPMPGGTGHNSYITVFAENIIPVLEAWQPQLLLVSAGFDAHQADPLAGLALTDDTYYWLGQQLKGIANKHCGGKLLSTLEGGYNLGVLPGSVSAYLLGTLAT
jgi:acetoin utilization deacetylase AcuC-like enzyme